MPINSIEHSEKHKQLHKYLDELIADFILDTGKDLEKSSIMQLVEWSFEQTIKEH